MRLLRRRLQDAAKVGGVGQVVVERLLRRLMRPTASDTVTMQENRVMELMLGGGAA